MEFEENFLSYTNKKYKKKTNLWWRIFTIFFFVYLIIYCIAFAFSVTFVQAQVVGVSMQPTFNKNLEYGTQEEYEESIYKDYVYANRFNKGTNGDVVLLDINGQILIKRLIATGGQKLTLKKQVGSTQYKLYVNDIMLDEQYLDAEKGKMDYAYYYGKFCQALSAEDGEKPVVEVVEDEAYIIVPQGKIFVLGDYRLLSRDSTEFGFVPVDAVIGKVEFSYAYDQSLFSYFWQKIASIF